MSEAPPEFRSSFPPELKQESESEVLEDLIIRKRMVTEPEEVDASFEEVSSAASRADYVVYTD